MKCHIDYDPANDNLIPCKEAGLPFSTGDILQIVNQEDVNWWQVWTDEEDLMGVQVRVFWEGLWGSGFVHYKLRLCRNIVSAVHGWRLACDELA